MSNFMSNADLDCVRETIRNILFTLRQTRDLVLSDCASVLATLGGLSSLQELKQRNRSVSLALALVATVTIALVAFQLSLDGVDPASNCPLQQPQRQKVFEEGPVVLFARFNEIQEGGSSGASRQGKVALNECIGWRPKQGGLPPLEQLQAQLKCHAAIVSASANEAEAASLKMAFHQRARSVLSALRGINMQCDNVHTKLKSLNRAGAPMRQPIDAIVALGGLGNFENSAREGLATLDLLTNLLGQGLDNGASGHPDLSGDLRQLHQGFHSCVLNSVREARMIAHAVPLDNSAVRQVQLCKPTMLLGLERLALTAKVSERDSGVTFSAGLLMSEVGTAPEDAPFFGPPSEASLEQSVDARGMHVPFYIATSESLLTASMDASSELDRFERSKLIAIHLAHHATFLTQEKQYTAAEWRYRASADLAKQFSHQRIATSSFAQLSYFLSLHGQPDQALEAAGEALQLGEDSLAMYIQASLRLASGELRTDEQLQEVVKQLNAVKGKLPLQELEEARAASLSKLDNWRQLSEAKSWSDCSAHMDATELLICAFGWVAETFA